MKKSIIYLTRHGETSWNREGKLQGHVNIELNETGLSQATDLKRLLENVSFHAVYTSDLIRAKRTAEVIVEGRNLNIRDALELREHSMGSWEGKLLKDLRAFQKENGINPYLLDQEEFLSHKWDSSVESHAEIYLRIATFLKHIAKSHPGETVLASSHGGVLRSMLYHLEYAKGFRWQIENCAFLKLALTEAGEIQLLEKNNVQTVAV